jgi:hypothetical protein
MDRIYDPGLFADGDSVRTADDHPLGEIAGFWPNREDPTHLIVTGSGDDADPGAAEWYVPTSAISGYQPGHLYLAATLDEARASGWNDPPAGGTGT